jgi:hypothetical protein
MEPNNTLFSGIVDTYSSQSIGLFNTPSTGTTLSYGGNGFIPSTIAGVSTIYNLTDITLKPKIKIMQNKVAVFKVTRDEDDKITKTEFIKELWVETKNGQSVDFQVARDKDLADYEISDLVIKVISTISF